MADNTKSVTLLEVPHSPLPSILNTRDVESKSRASMLGFRDLHLKSRASVAMTRDAKSRNSTYRDFESRLSKHRDGHKSYASSTHKDYGGFVRKGRTDLSSASRELLRRRLNSTGYEGRGDHTRQTSRVAGMEELPDPAEGKQAGELGQLFTVLRPTRRNQNIVHWPKDVFIHKFYPPHDQRHAMPLSIGPIGMSDGYGENGRRKSFHIQGPSTLEDLSSNNKKLQDLLGEFYKDKKYLDKFIEHSGRGTDERFFAERGRDFLFNMAGYWDRRTPIGERPPATNLGLRLARSQTCVF